MGSKRAKREDIERWRVDYWRIREKYSNKEIAEKLAFDEGNLIAYGKGRRNPGADFINRFYMEFADELGKMENNGSSSDQTENKNKKAYDPQSHPLPETEEPAGERRTSEVDFLRSEFSKVTNTAQTNADAFKNMSESNLILTKELAFYRKLVHPDKGDS